MPKDLSDTLFAPRGIFERHHVDTAIRCKPRPHKAVFSNQFEAIRRNVPWRTVLMDETGLRPRPRATAWGPQTAIVVGPNGITNPNGADEIHTDRLGRVRVKFHWQANPYAPQRSNSDHSCWMRVMQRSAGAGMGQQFIPRIGQEVLVGFINHDMDQPFVLAKSAKNALPSSKEPKGIQGFITALPVNWTAWENNLSGFNLTVIAMENTTPQPTMVGAMDAEGSSVAANTTSSTENQTV